MTRVFVTGVGIISPLGKGTGETAEALSINLSGIGPLTLFTPAGAPLPVGEVKSVKNANIPRTHALALIAAKDSLQGSDTKPEAVFIGTTTGGMSVTENLLKENITSREQYSLHSTGTVGEMVARKLRCTGPVVTVSTACSSAAVAIAMAASYLKSGRAKVVLAGGADSLCRLTYYGFNSLQLIDPAGARPCDKNRKGMSVAEGAAMLLLQAAETPPRDAIAEILGAGLSCDAYHPAAPRPDGRGAVHAMTAALEKAGILPGAVDYINLHGTGTIDNDLAEGKAVAALFGDRQPPLSSSKGAFGHSLGAAGAIEAVVSLIGISRGFIPASTGCTDPDPALQIKPVLKPMHKKISTVLSNSFGFGGNNASIVIGAPDGPPREQKTKSGKTLVIRGSSFFTGAGGPDETMKVLQRGGSCAGIVPHDELIKRLPPREVRRLKRFPRMSLALAESVVPESGSPHSVYFGTGWGALSETCDFLAKLYESDEQFTSPTDFVGSVHNAPAGQLAIKYGATGANVTLTGGDHTFEQAVLAASLAGDEEAVRLLIGADEYHEKLTPLLDCSSSAGTPSDGGGALLITSGGEGPVLVPVFLGYADNDEETMDALLSKLAEKSLTDNYRVIFAGIPSGLQERAEAQLSRFMKGSGFTGPVVDYRKFIGQHASATAAAAALAYRYVRDGSIPGALAGAAGDIKLEGKGILILGLGVSVSATGIIP